MPPTSCRGSSPDNDDGADHHAAGLAGLLVLGKSDGLATLLNATKMTETARMLMRRALGMDIIKPADPGRPAKQRDETPIR